MKYTHILLLLLPLLVACGTQSTTDIGSNRAPAPQSVAEPSPSPSFDTVLYPNIPLQSYTQPDNQYTISFPANWQAVTQPNGGVVFIDPTNRAAYGVLFTPAEEPLSATDLADFLAQFVQSNFGDDDGFNITRRTDATLQFHSIDPNLGASTTEISATQFGQMLYITQITITDNLWAITTPALRDLAATLQVLQTVPAETPPTPTLEPTWLIYTNPQKGIIFPYPNNWKISEDNGMIQAEWDTTKLSFSVETSIFSSSEPETALQNTLQNRLDTLSDKFSDFQQSPITSYQSGDGTGFTADYSYTNTDGIPMAKSSFVLAQNGALYLITIAAPIATYETALDWFNPMMQNFKIVQPE